ncbi:MAG: GDP-L-fucose synthase [Bacteroides sp.]|nr:GDP-L-fucose synthase [Bacteroides sp.]
MEKHSKIYVAGHRGLVGSAIWRNLQGKGYTNLVGRSHAELDLMDTAATARFFEEEKPEYVIVASAKVGGIQANSVYRGQFIYENLMIACNTIHQSYTHGVKKLLFLGSSCIYPRMAPQPMPEDCLLTSPLEYTNEPYALSKIAGLKMCESYNLQYGTDYISVMPTNLYGPFDNFNLETSHVLPAILRKMFLGKCLESGDWKSLRADLNARPVERVDGAAPAGKILEMLAQYGVRSLDADPEEGRPCRAEVEIWGSGKPLREFLWSEDMADACVYLLENVSFKDLSKSMGKEVRNTHINIGTGKEVTIAQTAQLIKERIGFGGELRFNADKPDGTPRKLLDVSKLHALGWRHQVELEEGVSRLADWYLQSLR